jgi:synaptobrevin family protein YKT6
LYFRKRREGIVVCVITDKEYPSMVAQSLATRVAGDFCDRYPRSAYENMAKPAKDVDPFPVPEIKTYIVQYQDPSEADTITKIEKELDETKQVVINNINLVMERGAKLDSLVAKSEDINASSKLFYTQVSRCHRVWH